LKVYDKLFTVALLPFGIFACMFLGALVAEIKGTLTPEAAKMLAQYSLIPGGIAAILAIVGCILEANRKIE
jgi:hypothetical protein